MQSGCMAGFQFLSAANGWHLLHPLLEAFYGGAIVLVTTSSSTAFLFLYVLDSGSASSPVAAGEQDEPNKQEIFDPEDSNVQFSLGPSLACTYDREVPWREGQAS